MGALFLANQTGKTDKVDFKKTLPGYKARVGQFQIVDIPVTRYLMIDGHAGPASREFAQAIETLYPVAYGLKFLSKQTLEKDYVVPPLEALWWADNWAVFTTEFDQSQWDWSAMIMLPPWITTDMFNRVLHKVRAKKSPPSLDLLRCVEVDEGRCVQTLHKGPFSEEGPVLNEMHESFIPDQGLQMQGKHHEIYFNDFRKTAPEKLRTLLRQPVRSLD